MAVGSAGEGIADVIRHGENGYLVPPGDAAALTDTLRMLLEGGEQVEAVRRQGIATAQSLTWRRNAEACTALYERAIDDANQA